MNLIKKTISILSICVFSLVLTFPVSAKVEGDTITEMRKRLEGMIKCLEEPVLDEQDIVDTPTKTKTIEDRVLELGLENAEMRDRLTELGEIIEKTKKVRSL